MYLFLKISDVGAPHRHGKIMVVTWLHLSVEILYLAVHVQYQNVIILITPNLLE